MKNQLSLAGIIGLVFVAGGIVLTTVSVLEFYRISKNFYRTYDGWLIGYLCFGMSYTFIGIALLSGAKWSLKLAKLMLLWYAHRWVRVL